MLVKVVSVSREDVPNKNGKGTYGKLTVAYRDDKGKLSEKTILSFTNPAVFKEFERAEAGKELNVKSEKVGDYWNWTAILSGEETASSQQAPASSSTATRVTGSNYETKEERALKQRYIVRQSSLTAALAMLNNAADKKTPINFDTVTDLANRLTDWVFEDTTKDIKISSVDISDIDDDIPY